MQIRRRPPHHELSVHSVKFQVAVPESEPQNILEEIVWHKEIEVDRWREFLPLKELKHHLMAARPPKDFVEALRSAPNLPAVIAEVKKASPSKGLIRPDFEPVTIARSLVAGGASCLSVLTDEKFFQGSFDYLKAIRAEVEIPLLCKEFILYPYQLYLARVHGADAVLLIAAILENRDLQYFLKIVAGLGMTALIEVHTLEELDRVLSLDGVQLVGINNRNLMDFSVSLDTTCELLAARHSQLQERGILVVSESGLYTSADLHRVADAGARAVLIGESLMRQSEPGQALAQLITG